METKEKFKERVLKTKVRMSTKQDKGGVVPPGSAKIIIHGLRSWRLTGLTRVTISWVMRWSLLFPLVVSLVWRRWVPELVDAVSLMESGSRVVLAGLPCTTYTRLEMAFTTLESKLLLP